MHVPYGRALCEAGRVSTCRTSAPTSKTNPDAGLDAADREERCAHARGHRSHAESRRRRAVVSGATQCVRTRAVTGGARAGTGAASRDPGKIERESGVDQLG